jgi:hypothetical protein
MLTIYVASFNAELKKVIAAECCSAMHNVHIEGENRILNSDNLGINGKAKQGPDDVSSSLFIKCVNQLASLACALIYSVYRKQQLSTCFAPGLHSTHFQKKLTQWIPIIIARLL